MMETHLTCTSEDPRILSDLEQVCEVVGGAAHWETGAAHREDAVHRASFLSAKIHWRSAQGRRGTLGLRRDA